MTADHRDYCKWCGIHRQVIDYPDLGLVCGYCLEPFVVLEGPKHPDVKPPKHSRSLLALAERDGWICQLCGGPVDPKATRGGRASRDHIVRKRDGGTREMSNLRLTHQRCNGHREKGAFSDKEPGSGHERQRVDRAEWMESRSGKA
jgi:hypothetical protein